MQTKDHTLVRLKLKSKVRRISRQRFDASVLWARHPIAALTCQEKRWFTDDKELLLAVAGQDLVDGDYVAILLERDADGRYAASEVRASLSTLSVASRSATRMIERRLRHEPAPSNALRESAFKLVVPRERLSKGFEAVLTQPTFAGARRIIDELWQHHDDVDGNFLEQLQTTGFDARIWELYLFAALRESSAIVTRPRPSPDFHAAWHESEAFIEAVTVANSGALADSEEARLAAAPTSASDIHRLNNDYMPIRFGSPLFSKLKKRYWESPGVAGRPLVFAIADFHADMSMAWSSTALFRYLYGASHQFRHDENGKLITSPLRVETHRVGGKSIPSGFFFQEDAEHISAVAFSAIGTISKFNRLGCAAGFSLPDTHLIRFGTRHLHDANASLPEKFAYLVRPGDNPEDWRQGLSIFHNPRALHPLADGAFPGCAHHWFREDNQIVSHLPEFHPYQNNTISCRGDAALRIVSAQVDGWLREPFPTDAHSGYDLGQGSAPPHP